METSLTEQLANSTAMRIHIAPKWVESDYILADCLHSNADTVCHNAAYGSS